MIVIRETLSDERRNATLSRQAFIDMVTNAVEVYKKESFGILLGVRHKKHYFVSDVIAYQTATNDYETVDVTSFRVNRINFALSHLTNQQVIGDYHSHPQGPDKLSATDVADLFKGTPSLTCLVSIYKSRRCEPWKRNPDHSISGGIGGKFFVRISAFEVEHKKNQLRRLKIVCPYMKRINKLKLYKKKLS